MQQRSLAALAALVVMIAPLSGACAAKRQAAGIQNVDNLVARIERLDLETELAQTRAEEAVGALRSIVRGELRGDAVKTHSQFVEAVQRSKQQLIRMNASIEPMQKAAASVFAAWGADIDAILSPTLKEKSAQRRQEAGERYLAIVQALAPAQAALAGFNRVLEDHCLFLGNDLNLESVAALEPELDRLREHLAVVDQTVEAVQRAAAEYVRTAAPLGKVQLSGASTPTAR